MQRKIEITNDENPEVEIGSPLPGDNAPPEFGDHVIAPEADSPGTAELIAELAAERAKREEAEQKVLYIAAEFQNFRRRRDDEMKELQKFANSELVRSVLPVLDNFERALAAAERTSNFDSLLAGVSGTMKQLQTALQKAGVVPIDAIGKEFDPNFHEAIGHTEGSELPANTVAEEVQRGYVMHDRVLRPSLVKVSQG